MTDQPFDLRNIEVILFAEGQQATAALRDVACWGGRSWFAETFADALQDLESRDVAALVVQAATGARAMELLEQASQVAPGLVRIAVAASEESLPLVAALNSGRLDGWVPTPVTDDTLCQALKTALYRQATESASRDLVELLRRRHETSERVIDALQQESQDLRLKLTRLAPTDRVTGLYNRRHLIDHWRRECARARRYGLELSLVMLAPRAGRELDADQLRRIGSFLVLAIRDVDLAGRFSEDRFVVVLPHCGRSNAEALARRLAARFSEHTEADETMWASGPWSSVGDSAEGVAPVELVVSAATLGTDGDDPGTVLSAVESALEQARGG
jgi:diguanylate cyclase (GGDEF)-like protein